MIEQWQCEVCGLGPFAIDPANGPIRHACQPGGNSRRESGVTYYSEAELIGLLPPADRRLLGDRIEQLTKAIGIPTCSGCESRKAWLNRAHAWLLGIT